MDYKDYYNILGVGKCVIRRHPFNEVVKIFEIRGVYGSRDSEKTTVGQTHEQAGNAGITCLRCGFPGLHSDNGGAGTILLELKGSGLVADVHDLHLTKRYLPKRKNLFYRFVRSGA